MVEPVVLAVGDPFRGRVRTTLVVSLGGVVVFMAFAWVTTQAQSVRAHSPWQDDPYDLVVSFAGLFVPLLAGGAMARVWLCRRWRPLRAARVRDLLRAAWLVSLSITVTVVADWVAVILGVHRAEWDGPGGLLIGALAILTVSAAVLLVTVRATGRAAPWRAFPAHPADPDWLDDLLAVATEATRMLGPLGPLARRLLGRGLTTTFTDLAHRLGLDTAALGDVPDDSAGDHHDDG